MFRIDASAIDKSLPISVGQQLHGLLTYALCFDNLPQGTKLQSVRQLADELGLSPMTVAQVYQQLRDAGLVEIRPGLGAFTAREARHLRHEGNRLSALRGDIVALIGRAERQGIGVQELVAMINAHAQGNAGRVALDLAFVGIFAEPMQDYLAGIAAMLSPRDRLRGHLLADLRASAGLQAECGAADLVITFVNREAEVRELLPGAAVLTLPFVAARATRQALAGLDPRAKVVAVSYFRDFVSIMRPSVREFAPHVADVTASWVDDPDLAVRIEAADAVVYASGAQDVAQLVRPLVPCFEFRHAPDPAALVEVLVPRLAELRRTRLVGNTAAAAPPPAGPGDAAAPVNSANNSAAARPATTGAGRVASV